MARRMHNPSIAELRAAIVAEDMGLTPKISTRDIKKMKIVQPTTVPTEVIAMNMAIHQCDVYYNIASKGM